MEEAPKLSTNEWAILGSLASSAEHGFAAAHDLSPKGRVGAIWTVSRPLVYRGISQLLDAGLLADVGTAPGRAGPKRHLLGVTPPGEEALKEWLVAPVPHVRDYRSELMLKLFFLHGDPKRTATLVAAQRRSLAAVRSGLERQLEDARDFDAVLARWRLSSAIAAEQFLDELAASLAR